MEFNKPYNRSEFLNFLQNNFLPDDFVPSIEEVSLRTKVKYTSQITKLGMCPSLDLVVYELQHKSHHEARVSLSKEAFRFLADEMAERALVIFIPENDFSTYRFSLIEITLDISENSARITRAYSNPRRLSHVLGQGIAYYTPNKYLNSLGRVVNTDDLRGRFSVEKLTKEFYSELSDWYAWAIKEIKFPNNLEDDTDNEKFNHESAIRMITRLIFIWFLKQRGLVPNEFFDEKYLSDNLLKNFYPNKKLDMFYKSTESIYYKAILQNLFFAMLNSPMTKEGSKDLTERRFRKDRNDYDNNKLMRYEKYFKDPQLFVKLANRQVPFLNGGLFDCLDDKDNGLYYDGFSDREKVSQSLVVPDYLFFGEPNKIIDLSDWYGDKNKKCVSAHGLLDILKTYNFTVEENTPFDQDVALDPELLGKVFENLLASYNPETQVTARKQTGSFYTPREIVQYMVDESLIAHLKRTVGNELENEYSKLLSYSDEKLNLNKEQKKAILNSLYKCKILDPACGSGAFPMGALQQMVHILNELDPDNAMWKEMMMEQAINETSHAYKNTTPEERATQVSDIERSFDENINKPDYARKLYLIENCIYGVDIQPIAIQISKLRFFISLVIDQNILPNKPEENFGIRPLPNLEAKFVAANTLVGLTKHKETLFENPEITTKMQQMKEAKHKIFGAKTVRTKRKYKEILINLRQEISKLLQNNNIIGNEDAMQLSTWDMFDQNSSSPFFDPEWMFGIYDKFDIIISNPPYIEAKKLKYIAKTLKEIYSVYSGTADFSIYFVERGINLLCPDGVLAFIMTNKFFNTEYGEKLRALLCQMHLNKIINFEQCEVFENVLVSSTILEIQKNLPNLQEDFTYEKLYKLKHEEFKDEFARRTGHLGSYPRSLLNSGEWAFSSEKDASIRRKIESGSTNLSDLDGVNIYRGVTTGFNSAFIVNDAEKTMLIKNSRINSEIIKNLLQGRNIRRWFYNESDENLLYIPWHFPLDKNNISGASKEAEAEFKARYPIIYNRFEKYKSELCKRNQDETGIRYEWYALQRCAASYCEEFERKEKIIWGLTADKWAFALDDRQHYLPSNGYILTSQHVPVKYILGLLNSTLLKYYFGFIGIMTAGGAYTLKAATISALPFKLSNNPQKVVDVVDAILKIKSTDHEADVADLERELDNIVYHIYNLDYDDIQIIDPESKITSEQYKKLTVF